MMAKDRGEAPLCKCGLKEGNILLCTSLRISAFA